MGNHNIGRISEDIKREISAAVRDIKDSRVAGGIVSITHCDVTNDLSFCKVYVSALGGGEKNKAAAECLQNAAGFFKKRINQRIKMRKIPELTFIADNSLDYYDKINSIVKDISEKDSVNDGNETD